MTYEIDSSNTLLYNIHYVIHYTQLIQSATPGLLQTHDLKGCELLSDASTTDYSKARIKEIEAKVSELIEELQSEICDLISS